MANNDRTMRIPTELAPEGVVAVAALLEAGLSPGMIARRCRPDGPWRRLLPGVVLLDDARPSRRQRVRAAACYGAPDGVITGVDALALHGVDVGQRGSVRLLLPAQRRIGSRWYLIVERTARLPRVSDVDGIPVAAVSRAAVDAARTAQDADDSREFLVKPVLHGLCTREDYVAELAECNQRGSAKVRAVLRRFDGLVASALHAIAREVVGDAPFAPAHWNATVCGRNGVPIGQADAWWERTSVAWLIERSPASLTRVREERALRAAGVTVVRSTLREVVRAAADERCRLALLRELSAAFVAGSQRPEAPVGCDLRRAA